MTLPYKKRIEHLKNRSLVVQAIRDFFTSHHYLEVDTPVRSPSVIPEAHIEPVTSETHFLQASPELCMKRLLSQGFDRIFQICKCFRKNERGSRHLPEMTLLEWYAKGAAYRDLMAECEDLICFIAGRYNLNTTLHYQGTAISIAPPWKRLTVKDAFEIFAEKSMEAALRDDTFDEVISFEIEPCLGLTQPVFLMDYPTQYAALARLKPDNTRLAERFELYIAGIELANAFTELTDGAVQRKRFEKENQLRSLHRRAPLPMPEKLLDDLDRMPDAAGIALGVDRLVMLFSNAPSIDDVVAFTPEEL